MDIIFGGTSSQVRSTEMFCTKTKQLLLLLLLFNNVLIRVMLA